MKVNTYLILYYKSFIDKCHQIGTPQRFHCNMETVWPSQLSIHDMVIKRKRVTEKENVNTRLLHQQLKKSKCSEPIYNFSHEGIYRTTKKDLTSVSGKSHLL